MDDVTRITCSANGPYLLKGPLEIRDSHGGSTRIEAGKTAALCRCGGSARKPFCDGSHSRIGFSDNAAPRGGGAG